MSKIALLFVPFDNGQEVIAGKSPEFACEMHRPVAK